GGFVSISQSSVSAMQIGGGNVPSISSQGPGGFGSYGGFVSISNIGAGTGGILLVGSPITVTNASSGGGSISFSATGALAVSAPSTLSTVGAGAGTINGDITVNVANVDVTGGSFTLNAHSVGSSGTGLISITTNDGTTTGIQTHGNTFDASAGTDITLSLANNL